jgi:hypothetical protein
MLPQFTWKTSPETPSFQSSRGMKSGSCETKGINGAEWEQVSHTELSMLS